MFQLRCINFMAYLLYISAEVHSKVQKNIVRLRTSLLYSVTVADSILTLADNKL